MKLKFDVTAVEYNIIHSILVEYLTPEYKVWVFGSRAKNQSKYNSDLDLAIEHIDKINYQILRKIKLDLEESKLPYKVDVLDINNISDKFRDIIKKDMITFPIKFLDKIPKLRFKEFSGEWEEKKLGDIATFYNSKRVPLTESDRKKGEYPYYGASGIIDYVEDYLFDGEYILLGEDGANIVLRNSRLVFLATGKFWVNNHAHVFQSKESNYFLCEALERINYTKYNTGTAQPKLNSDVVKKIHLKVPSKQEQEKIASFLTSVDTKIEQLTKKEQLLGQYKKGVMQKIFNQEIRFKADNGSGFPECEEKKLGDIGEFKSGTGFPEKEQGGTVGIPFFKVSDMNLQTNTLFMNEANNYVSQEQVKKLKLKPIIKESIIFAKVGAAIFLERKRIAINFLIDNNMMAFTPRDNINFLYHWINKIHLSKFAQVGALPSYNASDLKTIKISLPCQKEQEKIANFLSLIDTKIEQVQNQLKQTKAFKKALLQQMFV